MMGTARTATLCVALALGGCTHKDAGNPAPPRDESKADFPIQTSTIVVPIGVPLSEIEAGLNARVPRALWHIDRPGATCVPAKRVELLGIRAKVLPRITCRIVGEAVRGRIRLSGSGNRLIATLPVSATISAERIGGIIKRETATGTAEVRAIVTLGLDRNWQPTAKVRIAYDWIEPPSIDFLGQRIKLVEKADRKLQGVVAGLERDLPKELARIRTRERLEAIWRQAFTAIELNRDKPPAWMRITPQRLGFGGYRVQNGRLELSLAAEALTETFIGNRPSDPVPTALPPPAGKLGKDGLRFFVPVLADYAQLEPVVLRALKKRAAKGIALKGVGPVDATFDTVTVYATSGGRIVVGIKAEVVVKGSAMTKTRGVVWLTGVPYNAPGSQLVHVRDLAIAGRTDREAVNLLINLFLDPQVVAEIRDALSHDFVKDYTHVLTAARKAIASRREGDFTLSANISDVTHGEIKVTGQGLFLPVRADGTASITYDPGQAGTRKSR
jgi:hypothetical protein